MAVANISVPAVRLDECVYRFKRGNNKGALCKRRIPIHKLYCNRCSRNRCVRQRATLFDLVADANAVRAGQCRYIIQRGERKSMICRAAVHGNAHFCASCSKLKRIQQIMAIINAPVAAPLVW